MRKQAVLATLLGCSNVLSFQYSFAYRSPFQIGGKVQHLSKQSCKAIQTSIDMSTAKAKAPTRKEQTSKGVGMSPLGDSGLVLSRAGIGAMMFDLKTDKALSHRLLDVAFDEYGVNYLETAEYYPFPVNTPRFGDADRIVGSWLKGKDRSKVVIASKIAGRSNYIDWLRKDGSLTAVTPEQIVEAVEGSLERLGTDYIDLLQIGWPDRYTGMIAEDTYTYESESEFLDWEVQLMALQELISSGKVKHIGVVDETPHGVMKFIEHAEWDDLPRLVSVQNEFNLLKRFRYELGMMEVCRPQNCNLPLIAHTPLGGGSLTGKYLGETLINTDYEVRLNNLIGFQSRYKGKHCREAIAKYAKIAENHGMSPATMALQWVYSRQYVASTLIGATNEKQLRENLEAANAVLTPEMESEIEEVYQMMKEPTYTIAVA